MGKREDNKIIIRERLLAEAMDLFSKKGFDQTTVADIVAAAEIGRGTFYNYYDDVKGIFHAVIEQLIEEIKVVLLEARQEASNTYELLYFSFKRYFELVSTERLIEFHRKNLAYIRIPSYGSENIKTIVKVLKKEINAEKATSDFKEDHEQLLLSFLMVGTPAELFLNLLSTDININNDQTAKFLAKVFYKILKN